MGVINSCDAFWIMIAFPLGFGTGGLKMDNLLNWLLLFYTIFFGGLLIAFHVRLRGGMARFLRRNFGFMFSWIGRFAFLLFVATLLFTANEQWWYVITIGVLTVLVAVFNCCILCNHPAYQAGGELAADADGDTNGGGGSTSRSSAGASSTSIDDVKPSVSSSPFGDIEDASSKAADVSTDAPPSSASAWDDMDDNASTPSAASASSKGTKVVALYKFDADENDPEQISMNVDDVLTLIEKQSDGWAKVIKDGRKGVVPVQYISEANDGY